MSNVINLRMMVSNKDNSFVVSGFDKSTNKSYSDEQVTAELAQQLKDKLNIDFFGVIKEVKGAVTNRMIGYNVPDEVLNQIKEMIAPYEVKDSARTKRTLTQVEQDIKNGLANETVKEFDSQRKVNGETVKVWKRLNSDGVWIPLTKTELQFI